MSRHLDPHDDWGEDPDPLSYACDSCGLVAPYPHQGCEDGLDRCEDCLDRDRCRVCAMPTSTRRPASIAAYDTTYRDPDKAEHATERDRCCTECVWTLAEWCLGVTVVPL